MDERTIDYKTIEAIEGELAYQKSLVEEKDYKKVTPLGVEVLMMQSYLDKCRDDLLYNTGDEKALDTLRKVVTIGVRAMQNHGVYKRQKKE